MYEPMSRQRMKSLKIKALVNLGCIHTGIDEQLVKEKRIQMRPINFHLRFSM